MQNLLIFSHAGSASDYHLNDQTGGVLPPEHAQTKD